MVGRGDFAWPGAPTQNIDTMVDFFAPDDQILIENSHFVGLAAGSLAAPAFKDIGWGRLSTPTTASSRIRSPPTSCSTATAPAGPTSRYNSRTCPTWRR